MKKFLSLILLATLSFSVEAKSFPTMFAHRGCWSKNSNGEFIIPENSVAAVAMAKRMRYAGIECDVRYTKDGKMVIMHDKTINRTMRNAADYSKIETPTAVSDLTFKQLRENYVLESADPNLRTPIPTLEEILTECKKQGIIPMLHSSITESYRVAQSMFGDEWICFSSDFEAVAGVRDFSNCLVLYSINKGSAEQTIEYLKKIGSKCGVSTMNHKIYTPEYCKALTDAGYQVQASIFKSPKEVVAQRNGVTIQLTDFSIMPTHKPYSKWRVKGSGNHKWNKTKECGAILIDIEYCGTIEVIINGSRKYTLTREKMGHDQIGNRFFDLAPQVEIKVADGTIKQAVTKVFEY